MIGPTNTTIDWQLHTGRTVVWAVGAFEQHSAHLPLDTEAILGDVFARFLAEELGAALLPTQRVGTSLEQTGFRGTLTLRPETLMAIVRDMADEVERQSFTRLVLVNTHGGNHCLVPVVRDINRQNRALKILLVNFWEFADPETMRDICGGAPVCHADAFEISLFLAMAPELLRPNGPDITRRAEALPLQQGDLTTFGVGTLSPGGTGGFPSRASKEAGERLIASIQAGMLAFVRDRLRRLDDQPRYSGRGGLAVRTMTTDDLPDAMRLKTIAGWNQLENDWRIFLEDPARCFACVHNGQVVGTTLGIDYAGVTSWIGMVLVDPEFRRMGIATKLMAACVESLASCRCIKLDATPAGKTVYDNLGFVDEYLVRRMTCKVLPRVTEERAAAPLTLGDLDALVALDTVIFGADRRAVLAALLRAYPGLGWKVERDGVLAAACLGRPGANFHQVGPVLAQSFDDARAVIAPVLRALTGRPAVLDVPEMHGDLLDWLESLAFFEERHFIRQVRGENVPGKPECYFAIAGPEFG
jgi:creatinine amidohydrolase/Fe(II)-dependent formamide hydrolase-like protein/GNAT superfamily N-acetyltransferase